MARTREDYEVCVRAAQLVFPSFLARHAPEDRSQLMSGMGERGAELSRLARWYSRHVETADGYDDAVWVDRVMRADGARFDWHRWR